MMATTTNIVFLDTGNKNNLPANSRYREHEIVSYDGMQTLQSWKQIDIPPDPSDIQFEIPLGHDRRPDLTSALFYQGNKQYWWVILRASGIINMWDEYVVGRSVRVPLPTRLFSKILKI